jgi:hypothetical protein
VPYRILVADHCTASLINNQYTIHYGPTNPITNSYREITNAIFGIIGNISDENEFLIFKNES